MKIARYIVDAVMVLLFIVLMGCGVTGEKLHEILGVALVVLFVVHCVMNYRWFKNIINVAAEAETSVSAFIRLLVNVLVIVDLLVIAITSLFVSEFIFAGLKLQGNYTWRYIHIVASYVGIILASIHIGCNFKNILLAMRNKFKLKDNRIRRVVLRVLALAIVVLGVITSCKRDIAGKFVYENNNGMNGMKFDKNFDGQRPEGIAGGQMPDNSQDGIDGRQMPNNSQNGGSTATATPNAESNSFMSYVTVTSSEATATPKVSDNSENNNSDSKNTDNNSNNRRGGGRQFNKDDFNNGENGHNFGPGGNMMKPGEGMNKATDNIVNLFLDYIPIICMYIAITYYILETIDYKKRKTVQTNQTLCENTNNSNYE